MTLRSLAAAALAASIAVSVSAAEPSMALVLGVKGSPFDQALARGGQAKELRLRLAVFAPGQFSAESQVLVLNADGATAPDVAVPTDARALIAPMRQFAERGAKRTTVDQTVVEPAFFQTQIMTDNARGGRLAAGTMARRLGGKGDCR